MLYLLKQIERIIFSWIVHTAHSIHVLMQKMCISVKSLYVCREKPPDKEGKALLKRFILRYAEKDAELLRHIYSSILLNSASQITLKAAPLGICIWNSFKTPSWDGPVVHTVPVRTSVKPTFSHHTETGQQILQLAFLRLAIIPISLSLQKRHCPQTAGIMKALFPRGRMCVFSSVDGWWIFVVVIGGWVQVINGLHKEGNKLEEV